MISRVFKAVSLGLFIAVTALIISFVPLFHELEEDTGLGLLFRLRGVRRPPSEVMVVSIDKDSSDRLRIPNNPDKWPRSLHARLVEKLSKAGARVITFDVHFLEARTPEDDRLFTAALAQAGNVVIADALTANEVASSDDSGYESDLNVVKILKPYEPFAQAAVATAPFVLPRIPFKVNQYWTFQTEANNSPTFPVVALQLFNRDAYSDFIGVLEKASPNQTGKLPRNLDGAIKTKNVLKLMTDIRELFESDSSLSDRMIEELGRLNADTLDSHKSEP